MYVVTFAGVCLISRFEALCGFMPGGHDYCGLLIPVHRSTSGFRQRRVAAQELESTTQGKTSRLLNTLGTRLCSCR
jgi:hypothetical protein